jgi:hypothetical protein
MVGPGPLSTSGPGVVSVSLPLYGPRDIKGPERVVIRTWPRANVFEAEPNYFPLSANVFEAEPNYFPLIELDPADLPWRYTPARAAPTDRLRPWLCLVVLRDDEIANYTAPTADRPNGVVTVTTGAALPLLDQSWAWAHVQVSGQVAVDPATILDLLKNEPHRIIARLLCPRRLDERTMYTGFLVPALEPARLAGLGQKVDNAIDGLAPAWTAAAANIQLPAYYQWRFQTGGAGDFESLIRRVQPRPMPKAVGSRPMDVASPGLGLPAAARTPLSVEAALRALTSEGTTWTDADRSQWVQAIENVVNRPARLLATPNAERTVAPPLYGRWYAGQDTLDVAANRSWWFADLNADPRNRVAAGIGTFLIQQSQQQFLAGAWAQVEGIRAANASLRQAQLAREAAVRLYERHVVPRPVEQLLMFTAPVHPRIPTSPRTVAAVLRESPASVGVLTPAWRRIARPRGPLGQRLASTGQPSGPTLLERLNQGTLRAAPPPPVPSQMVTPARAGHGLLPPWITPQFIARLTGLLRLNLFQLLFVLLLALVLFLIGAAVLAVVVAVGAIALKIFGQTLLRSQIAQDLSRREAVRSGTLTATQILQAPPRPSFVPAEFGGANVPPTPSPQVGATEHPAATRFRTAAAAAFDKIQTSPAAGPVFRSADFGMLRTKIVATLDPRTTVAASYRQRLALGPGVVWDPPDPLEPVMPAPVFTEPMYRPLYRLSADWILPGLDQVPQDTVSLVRTNERFVEAYMVGANHEMARTLLFNEYPTDQRGTYFRQFWDSSPHLPPLGQTLDSETLKDIKPIDTWGKSAALGENSSRTPAAGADFLVLLLRSELLGRYPNTVVYAARAKWNARGMREVDDTLESTPQFQGNLGAGVGFWGFALTAAEARGGDRPADDPGWFFIFQEPPTEPRCGLEPAVGFGGPAPDKWAHLSWGHLAADADALKAMTYIDLNAALPDTRSIVDPKHAVWHADAGTGATGARASDLAYITYRTPIRVAVHASQLIPPELEVA